MRGFTGLKDIVENGFCLSCGLCTGCAPEGVVRMTWSPNGHLRPTVTRPLTPEEDTAVLRLCPGVKQIGPFGDDLTDGQDHVWGDIRRVALAWAADPQVRFRSSTGGVMSSVNRYLLESGRASFILQVRADAAKGMETEPVFVRDPDDLLTRSQSRYGSSAPLTAIYAALELGEPFAVSLKPCDVAGVRNLQREDERARKLIVFTQAMICGSVPNLGDSMGLLRRQGADRDRQQPVTFQWRGNGCPGPIFAKMPDGREIVATYREMYVDNPTHTQFRCKICPDAIGLQADLVAADSWPDADPVGESEGTNVVVARTETGSEVLSACQRLGYLEVREGETALLDSTQPHQARLRRAFGARIAGAIVGGVPTPTFTGLAQDQCANDLSPDDLAAIFRGAIERVRAGQTDESVVMDDWEAVKKSRSQD